MTLTQLAIVVGATVRPQRRLSHLGVARIGFANDLGRAKWQCSRGTVDPGPGNDGRN